MLHSPTTTKPRFSVRTGARAIFITGEGYSLRLAWQRPEMDLIVGRRVARLRLTPAVDTVEAFDRDAWLSQPVLLEVSRQSAVLVWRGGSALWPAIEVELRAWPGGFSYGYNLTGRGALDQAHFWRDRRTGSPAFDARLFNPEPNSRRVRYSGERCPPGSVCQVCYPDPDANARPDFMVISAGRDLGFHAGNWLFTPAPYCYAVQGENGWLSVGIAAEAGGWNFEDFCYPGGDFGFSLVYNGHQPVDGHWRSPRLLCLAAPDEYAAVERYCAALRASGLTPDHGRGPAQGWWREPVFCGWGEQISQEVYLGDRRAPALATEANYRQWLADLDAQGLAPGTLVIDDKWQLHYGTNEPDPAKWDDLPGFVAEQDRQGRRTLLWLKAWDPEGVPPEECIQDGEGRPVAVDPGQPAYRRRLAEQVERMLAGYGAAGFKIDFTHLIPRGPALEHAQTMQARAAAIAENAWFYRRKPVGSSVGGKWGLELMREWLQILSEAACAARPDAVIIAHTANPYLADLVDVLRLNDVAGFVNDIHASIVPDMRHRARVARAASPYWLLESDNWPCSSRRQWREYIQAQHTGEFGIPSLYHARRFGWGSVNDALEAEDYDTVRECWQTYRQGLTGHESVIASQAGAGR